MPSDFATLMHIVHIEAIGPSQQRVKENIYSPMSFQSYGSEMEPVMVVELVGMTEPIMITTTNFVDILPSNDDYNVELFDEDDADEDIMNMDER